MTSRLLTRVVDFLKSSTTSGRRQFSRYSPSNVRGKPRNLALFKLEKIASLTRCTFTVRLVAGGGSVTTYQWTKPTARPQDGRNQSCRMSPNERTGEN